MRSKRWIRFGALALVLTLAGAACSDDEDKTSGPDGNKDLSGEISVDGSSTVGPITSAIAEAFAEDSPGVDVAVSISGTGGGFEKFCNGEIDIVDASRPIKDEEKAACADKSVEYTELTVANDGLAVVTHKDTSWIDCISIEQLKTIWDDGSKVKSWKDVDPAFPDQAMPLFGPGTDSGTFDYFTAEVNGDEGRSRTDFSPSEDDNVLVTGVSGQAGALGYFGLAYLEQNKDKLKGLSVSGEDGECIDPTVTTVQSSTYPLSRPLFIYVTKTALARPEVDGFLDFYLDNVGGLVIDVGYVPLTDEVLGESKAALEAAKA